MIKAAVRGTLCAAVLALCALPVFAQNGGAAGSDDSGASFFIDLYRGESTADGQNYYVSILADRDFSTKKEFFTEALKRCVAAAPQLKRTKDFNELTAANEMVRTVMATIADEHVSDEAADVYRVFTGYDDSLVKSEALITLGKLNATQYLPSIVKILEDTTSQEPPEMAQNAERVAYGAITALRAMDNPAAYSAVFGASTGWYSQWVTNAAKDALDSLSGDPYMSLSQIIDQTTYTYAQKVAALQIAATGPLTNDEKASIALLALAEGHNQKTNDPTSLGQLAQLRNLALQMLRRNPSTDDSVYDLINKSYRKPYDNDERLNALALLGTLRTDRAVDLLGGYLAEFNEQVAKGGQRRGDDAIIRALIANLGQTGSVKAAQLLRAVSRVNYPTPIIQMATQALENIQGENPSAHQSQR